MTSLTLFQLPLSFSHADPLLALKNWAPTIHFSLVEDKPSSDQFEVTLQCNELNSFSTNHTISANHTMSSEQKNRSVFISDQSQMRVKSDWELKELQSSGTVMPAYTEARFLVIQILILSEVSHMHRTGIMPFFLKASTVRYWSIPWINTLDGPSI